MNEPTPAGASPAPASLGVPRAASAAALAGFGCMAAELTAVRVLAPHFGDSAYVWTNVIGVILAALAAGAWLGGRLAGRADCRSWPARLLLTAGMLLVVVPFVAGTLGAWLLPGDLPLDAAMPAIVRGSFVATTVLFAPPMLLLGAVAPLLVTLLSLSRVPVGRAAGAVSAAGTIGSLAGTFAATHWLVPTFGCRIAMTAAGGLLVLAGVALVVRGRAPAVALLVAAAVAPWLHGGPLRPPPPGRELLAERESRVQFLQVHRERPQDGPARTLLVINEGLDSYHSLAVEGSAFTGGAYYDWHMLAPLLAGDGHRPEGLRALSIGDAAGSLRAAYAGAHPGAIVDAVDIDPACLELGAVHFPAAKAPGDLYVVDGRVFLGKADRHWHVIHVDAYAHQVYVPAHLASREFFAVAHDRLLPGGVVACNVGALHDGDPVLRAIGTTVAQVFGHALAFQVPNSRNFLLVARRAKPLDPANLARLAFGAERLSEADAAAWRRIVQSGAERALWHDVATGGLALDDDRPVLDQLLHASYVDRRESGEVVACRGGEDAAGAEAAAYEAARRRDWHGVLRAVAGSRAATSYLRELAGDARWSLRQLRTAALEYASAAELSDELAVRARLRTKRADVESELRPIAAAEWAASRNGWLQILTLVVGLCVITLLRVGMSTRGS